MRTDSGDVELARPGVVDNSSRFADSFVGRSTAFESISQTIEMIARRSNSVIILGETGSGKEMVARQIHAQSKRASRPFVPVDCTSLNGSILQSQLFGHVKGAFTGAVNDTLGFFRAADGGTIFLDEIGELDLDLQAKLLRVLQESAVTPVGSPKAQPIDVRVLCATHRDLKSMIREGRFRADLYFRLNIVSLEVPPLRERREDIPLLCGHFLEKQAALYDEPVKTLSDQAMEVVRHYHWPGNVRELGNVMERAHILSRGRVIDTSDLPSELITGELVQAMQDDGVLTFKQLQKRLVVRALDQARGRKMAAARLLDIDHRKLGKLVDEFDLTPSWK